MSETVEEDPVKALEELLKAYESDIAYYGMMAAKVRADIINLKRIAKNENSTGN